MHGISERHTTQSMSRYVFYYATPLIAVFDKEKNSYVKCTRQNYREHLVWFITYLCVVGTYYSLQFSFPNHLPQFGTYHQYTDEEWFHWKNIFRWKQLVTTLYYAALMELYLKKFSHGLTFALNLIFGLQFEPMMDNPLSQSTSITDFWGKRWNLLIHRALQRGVYRPLRKHYPKYIAMVSAFVASAIYHEWVVLVAFTPMVNNQTSFEDDVTMTKHHEAAITSSPCTESNCDYSIFGYSSIFFLWQAVLMGGQYLIGHWKVFNYFPFPINTILILILGGCTGYYFTEPYVRTNYFIQGSFLFPLFVPLTA